MSSPPKNQHHEKALGFCIILTIPPSMARRTAGATSMQALKSSSGIRTPRLL
jgi:hypothetical protein